VLGNRVSGDSEGIAGTVILGGAAEDVEVEFVETGPGVMTGTHAGTARKTKGGRKGGKRHQKQ
jgi:hypothetical protein